MTFLKEKNTLENIDIKIKKIEKNLATLNQFELDQLLNLYDQKRNTVKNYFFK